MPLKYSGSDAYLAAMRQKHKPLFLPGQFQEVWKHWKDTGSATAHTELVERNLRLVHSIAKDESQRKGTDFLELYQVLSIALMKALEMYDPSTGNEFVTYATMVLRRAARQRVDDTTVRLPVQTREEVEMLKFALAKLEQEGRKKPTREEVAEFLGWKAPQFERVWGAFSFLSMPSVEGTTKSGAKVVNSVAAKEDSPWEISPELAHQIVQIAEKLDKYDKAIFAGMYLAPLFGQMPRTYEEIALVSGVTKQYIGIRAKALRAKLQIRAGHVFGIRLRTEEEHLLLPR